MAALALLLGAVLFLAAVSAQLAPKLSARARAGEGRPEGGINAAVRELGIDRTEAQRAVKIAERVRLTEEKEQAKAQVAPSATPHTGGRQSQGINAAVRELGIDEGTVIAGVARRGGADRAADRGGLFRVRAAASA